MPAEGLLIKPLIERPGNATAPATAGSLRAISDICRITFSVRSNVAPCGSWANENQIHLVLDGHKTRRHVLEADDSGNEQKPVDHDGAGFARQKAAHALAITL